MKILIRESQGGSIIRGMICEEKRRRKKELRELSEEGIENSVIINVDIQPEYEKYIAFNKGSWVDFINSSYWNNEIIFLYNGYDTLGMVSENEYKEWLYELGIEKEVIENSIFYDKGYAFFRYCMDNGIDDSDIISLVRFMIDNGINDSRDITEEMWELFSDGDIKELMLYSDDMINIPDLMDFLSGYNNIKLLGGGIKECLKEVEISLMVLDKSYNIINKYTY